KCHGYLGIEVPDAVTMPILNQNIVNPAKLSKDRANEVCGQCHMRGKSVPDNIFGYPWNDTTNSGFLPGENLSEYYEDHGEYYKDASGNITASEAHHQQWEDFQTSVHYQNPNDIESAPSECFNCHNPHNLEFETEKGTYNETQVENNELCLGCHEPYPPFNNNTTHFTDKYTAMSGIECTKCHMTKTSKSAAWNTITGTPQGDLKQGDIHSHRFNPIEPKYSGDNSVPTGLVNSCNQAGCHTDKTQFDYDEIADYIKGVAPPPVTGDINGDGNVDMDDAILVAQMVIGKYPADVEKADFNENGRVDIGDASKIAFYVVGKIPSL
ncbi:MAG: ammonia-forming cytochrome c nitrite reductase subunit c552, partial [Methanosarcinales archaeon]